MTNRFTNKNVILIVIYLLIITMFNANSNIAIADGIPNAGKCYNGWHNDGGRCHPPHGESDSGKRYIKNGGKCYNGWFLDTKKNKCVKSRGLWGWLID
mgnify:CR=1 FL=1|tara:strand:- start:171 stop:464 length:294 start_codon:yes stop_codon:yes gene_type:complete